MGLDLLDVAFRVEKTFGISLAASDFEQLARERDVVVGDLYELILRKIRAHDTVRTDVRLNFAVWEELRQKIGYAAGVAVDDVQLKTPLETLFPLETRRRAWEALRAAGPYRIATLDYPWAVRPIGLLLAAAMALVEQFRIWQIPGAIWLWPILGLFGIWMFAETYSKMMWILAAWRLRFPLGMKTVKDLVRDVLRRNSEAIVVAKQGAGGDYIPVDDRCIAVWQQLRQILSDALGVNIEKVTLESRLVADLGAS
jgi:acyl carrier protein